MVALRAFQSNGDWDRESAAQALVVIRALYENRRDVVESMLGSNGQIIIWSFNGGFLTPWPPSFSVIRSGTGRYWVHWAGTTSLRQAGSHLHGSVIVPHIVGAFKLSRAGHAQTNYAWLDVMADQMLPILDTIAAVGPATALYLCGHSYGGAVAALAGEYVAATQDVRCEVMTLGAPRIWSKGLLIANPDVYYRLENEYDLVTASPAPGDEIGYMIGITTDRIASLAYQVFQTTWADFGVPVLLTADGTGVPKGDIPVPPPEWVSQSFADAHFTQSYMGAVIESWKRQVG